MTLQGQALSVGGLEALYMPLSACEELVEGQDHRFGQVATEQLERSEPFQMDAAAFAEKLRQPAGDQV